MFEELNMLVKASCDLFIHAVQSCFTSIGVPTWLNEWHGLIKPVRNYTKVWKGLKLEHPRLQSSWDQHGAHLGPVGPGWAPCWTHEPYCLGFFRYLLLLFSDLGTLCEKVYAFNHWEMWLWFHMCKFTAQRLNGSLRILATFTLQWHHNGHDGVSNHQPLHCVLNRLFIRAKIKENIKAPRHWPLCGEFTGGRWIPRTNGQ